LSNRRNLSFNVFLLNIHMTTDQKNNPLHGLTLEMILNRLVEDFGWEELGQRIRINCFTSDPSIASSLKFLRKTPWARSKVEQLFLDSAKNDK
jgi:uncharacterized protein (DUF2132 family)